MLNDRRSRNVQRSSAGRRLILAFLALVLGTSDLVRHTFTVEEPRIEMATIPADVRLVEAILLKIEEATLTDESVPVE
ncbi:MAG: hypothetical protein Q7U39_01115 [Nitrospira sp.]|nr:hypothetical protein [Nitrospira sp.]